MSKIIQVTGGRFYCDTCGKSFVGTWRGPVEEMTCPFCKSPMRDEEGIDVSTR